MLAHRGPDEAGLHADAHAALAHRRLSIVDLAGGHQPLANEDGTRLGRLQRRDLQPRRRPAASSKRAATGTARARDTETIVHAYEQWGDDCVHRFRGMFAFAIWDAPKRRLLLVRDRLGIKPLYWARAGDRLLFGSEIKALLASGLVAAEANARGPAGAAEHRATSPATDTLFRGIHKLLPGHCSCSSGGRVAHRGSTGTCRCASPSPSGDALSPSRGRLTWSTVPRAARRIGAPAADERRAARHVPVGRHRQQRHRRADGAA